MTARGKIGVFLLKEELKNIESYIKFLLDNMKIYFDNIYITSEKKLSKYEKEFLKQYGIVIFEGRVDEWTIFQETINKLRIYHEKSVKLIVFFSSNLIGPVCDLEAMLNQMNETNNDFWGIFPQKNPNGSIGLNYDFWAIGGRLYNSYEFNMFIKAQHSLNEFPDFFSEKGYRWNTYIDFEHFYLMTDDPMLYYAKEIIEEQKAPFFLKKILDVDYSDLLNDSLGESARKLVEYIRESQCYNESLLWDYLTKNRHQSDFVKLLHLNYTLSTTLSDEDLVKKICMEKKIALVIHIYRTDMLKIIIKYALCMPSETDLYITTDTEEKKIEIEKAFRATMANKIEVRIIENRGRDVSSKLVGVKDIIMQYDYVCCIHDKKTPHLKPMTVGEGFSHKCFDNIIFNRVYVNNVITLFEKNPRIGIAVPPEPNHAHFFTTLGFEWSGNYEIAVQLGRRLNLTVPMGEDKEPVAPLGSFFWFRPKAMKLLYDQDWHYEDFPEEPIADNNTILHAIERIYPFVVQEEGYYPVIIQSDYMASLEYTNIKKCLRDYNQCLIKNGIMNKQRAMCEELTGRIFDNGWCVVKEEKKGIKKKVRELLSRKS